MAVQTSAAGVKRDDFSGCPDFLKEFLNYELSIRNLSPRTVNGYERDLRTFFRFLRRYRGDVDPDLSLEEISSETILLANQSVESMVNSVANLETILKQKLDLFDDCVCGGEPQ